jgi:hypothetical protein
MGSSRWASVQEQSPKQDQQHILWKFAQFLKHQHKFKLAHELPHAKVLTTEQPTTQKYGSSV